MSRETGVALRCTRDKTLWTFYYRRNYCNTVYTVYTRPQFEIQFIFLPVDKVDYLQGVPTSLGWDAWPKVSTDFMYVLGTSGMDQLNSSTNVAECGTLHSKFDQRDY